MSFFLLAVLPAFNVWLLHYSFGLIPNLALPVLAQHFAGLCCPCPVPEYPAFTLQALCKSSGSLIPLGSAS